MPTGNELAGVGNLLALPLTLKWMHDQWEQQKAAQGQLAAGAQVAGPGAPTTTTMPQQQLGPEPPNPTHLLQTPVLGTALRGIGTVGQVLQVMGMPPPKAPRPPTMKESWEFQRGQQKAESARKISEMMTDPQLKELAKIDPGRAISIQLGPYGSEWKAYAAGVLQKDPNKSLEDVVKDFEAMKTQQAGQRAGETTGARERAKLDVYGPSRWASKQENEWLARHGINPTQANPWQLGEAHAGSQLEAFDLKEKENVSKSSMRPIDADTRKNLDMIEESLKTVADMEELAKDPEVQAWMGRPMSTIGEGIYKWGAQITPKTSQFIQDAAFLKAQGTARFLHGSRHIGLWRLIWQHIPDLNQTPGEFVTRASNLKHRYEEGKQVMLKGATMTIGDAAREAGTPTPGASPGAPTGDLHDSLDQMGIPR